MNRERETLIVPYLNSRPTGRSTVHSARPASGSNPRRPRGLKVEARALSALAREAFADLSFYLRPSFLANLAAILDDPQASANDRFVAEALLRNAVISAEGELPLCQDTGTINVLGL